MKSEHTCNSISVLKNSWILNFALFCVVSCNNSSRETSNGNPNPTDSTRARPAAALAQVSGDLYTLRMTKTQYENLKGNPPDKAHKILFQFFFKTTDPKYPTLLAYASKPKNQMFGTLRIETLVPVQPFLPIPTEAVFGDQQLTIKEIDDFISDVVGNGTWTSLIFSPQIDADKHMYYKLTVEGSMTLSGALETNPSPPKDAD
jgi:hypothetical protein